MSLTCALTIVNASKFIFHHKISSRYSSTTGPYELLDHWLYFAPHAPGSAKIESLPRIVHFFSITPFRSAIRNWTKFGRAEIYEIIKAMRRFSHRRGECLSGYDSQCICHSVTSRWVLSLKRRIGHNLAYSDNTYPIPLHGSSVPSPGLFWDNRQWPRGLFFDSRSWHPQVRSNSKRLFITRMFLKLHNIIQEKIVPACPIFWSFDPEIRSNVRILFFCGAFMSKPMDLELYIMMLDKSRHKYNRIFRFYHVTKE